MKKGTGAFVCTLAVFSYTLYLLPVPASAGTEYNASSFNLVGPNGRVTAQITSSVEGTPALFFYDEERRARLSLGLFKGGAPIITLIDNKGNTAGTFRLADDGKTPAIILQENETKKEITLEKNENLTAQTPKNLPNSTSVESTPIRSRAETRREYLILGTSFLLGLAGAYVGGRIATRKNSILELLSQEKEIREAVSSELIAQKDTALQKEAEWRARLEAERKKQEVDLSLRRAEGEKDARRIIDLEVTAALRRAREAKEKEVNGNVSSQSNIIDSVSLNTEETLPAEQKPKLKVKKITHGAYAAINADENETPSSSS